MDKRIIQTLHEAFQLLKPRERLDPYQWSCANLHIPSGESRYPGPFSAALMPYQQQMLEVVGEPKIHRVSYMLASQTGKTNCLLALCLYYVHHLPSSVGFYSSNAAHLDEFSKDRLQPTVDASPNLKPLLRNNASKKSLNSIRFKRFRNSATIRLKNASVGSSFRGPSMRLVVCDEIDDLPFDAMGEGDPITQLKSRTTIWGDMGKLVLASTPTITDASLIETSFKDSDMRYYWVPCPACKTHQTLEMSSIVDGERVYHFVIPKDNPDNAHFVCKHCGEAIYEQSKGWMLANGEWRKSQPEVKNHAGFCLNTFYSPLFSWERMASEWLEACRKGKLAQKAYINTRLAQSYADYDTARLNANTLEAKREYYSAFIPKEVAYICGFCDVQKDRLEFAIYGFGLNDHVWLIRHYLIYGATTTAFTPAFHTLDKLLDQEFTHESGNRLRLLCTFVDSGEGGKSAVIGEFCQSRIKRAIFASKGSSSAIKGATKRSSDKKGQSLIMVDTDQLKHALIPRLSVRDKDDTGYIHLPAERIVYIQDEDDLVEAWNEDGTSADNQYLEQYLAEYVAANGRWAKKPGRTRNEALDCFVGAVGAFIYARKERWAAVNIQAQLQRLNGQPSPQTPLIPKETTVEDPAEAPDTPLERPLVMGQTNPAPPEPVTPEPTLVKKRFDPNEYLDSMDL